MTTVRGRMGFLAVSLSLLLLAGCAGGAAKRSTAAVHAGAVERVLLAIEAGLDDGDEAALVDLWEPSVRAAARKRIAAGLAAGRLSAPALTLIDVRVEDGRVHIQSTWSGRLDGEPTAGRFGLVLSDDGVLAITSASGDVPWAAAQRTGQSGSALLGGAAP